MEILRQLILLLGAPALYFAVGLPWVTRGRVAWAPLWGIGAMGLSAELAYIAGLPAWPCSLAVALLHFVVAVGRIRRREFRTELPNAVSSFAGCYFLALIPLVVAPFPIPGGWGGDWLLALESGWHIFSGERFTPQLLARPPFLGAASTLLLPAGAPLVSFQIFCAVASACALQVVRSALPEKCDRRILWILAGSVFFLHITANAWPKFLSAAFLLAAWETLKRDASRRDWLAGGVLLGLALATHQSAVLFAPLVLVRGWQPANQWGREIFRVAAIGAIAALLVLPWEAYTLAAYGWEAKRSANPVIAERLADVPAWLNALLVGVTTFVAWGPIEIVRHWLGSADRFTLLRIAHEVYWISTDAFNSLAGSVLGLVLPWWLALGTREFLGRVLGAWRRVNGPARVALALALAGQMVLNPYYSVDGSLQTGWVPFGVAVALWFASEMAAGPAAQLQRVLKFTLWFAAAPWLLFHFALTAALTLSASFRGNYVDADLQRIEGNHWASLGLAGFPWLPGLLAAVAVTLWFRRSHSRAAVGATRHVLNPSALT